MGFLNGFRDRSRFLPALKTLVLIAGTLSRISNCALAEDAAHEPRYQFDADWPAVRTMLVEKCGRCHRDGGDQHDLTTYNALMAGKSSDDLPLIVPGRPIKSPLWTSVVWDPLSTDPLDDLIEPDMPPEAHNWLTAGQLATLKRWIENGALQYKLPATCSTRPLMEVDFPSAKVCSNCHPKQYKEWSRSMHAYAMHSPIMEAFNLTLVERTSGTIGTFCVRCHTPIGTALGENGSTRNIHRSRISMEGVTCVVCHKLAKPYYKSNVRFPIQPGDLAGGCVFGPFNDSVSEKHNAHKSRGSAYIKSSAFCGTCHDVTNPAGVRLEEAFSEWQHSPAAANGVTCQHCHMGPAQGLPIADCRRPMGRAVEIEGIDPEEFPLRHLSDHTFAGPDYSILPDTEFPEKLDWMYEVDYRDASALTPYQAATLKELRLKNREQLHIANQKRYELLRNAARISVQAPRCAEAGDTITVHVDVKSIFAGHNFPTGFTAERQAWVEVVVFNPRGYPIYHSGNLDRDGNLRDEHSHYVETGELAYDRDLLNFQAKFVNLTQRGTERSVIVPVNRHIQPLNILRPAAGIPASFGRPAGFRLAKSSLLALDTAGKNYRIDLPKQTGMYALHVRLNFRHIPPNLLDEIGIPHLKKLLEVVVIDQFCTGIRVDPE